MLPYPPSIRLANAPTPLEAQPTLSRRLGVELLVKRDDLTGSDLTGNKVRKLEFLLAEARERRADIVLTCGGAQSNHCRATAIAARRLGIASLLFLRTPHPASPPPVEGNILLDLLVGAVLRYITPAEYARRAEMMAEAADLLAAEGRRAYVIPEGGSNAVGAWGYVRCVEELAAQLPPGPATLVYAAGSGGTGAGLLLGIRLLGLPWRAVGVNVCDDREYFVGVIGRILDEVAEERGLDLSVPPEDIEILDGHVGLGYAISSPEELTCLRDVARDSGLILDPVYTGKAYRGLSLECRANPGSLGERVVFIHTGGIFGLFPKAAELTPLL